MDYIRNLKKLRDSNGQCECNFFKAMGLDYMYVNDGNNVEALVKAFSKVKDIQHPVVVHINTLKGKVINLQNKIGKLFTGSLLSI